jgi:hypothetical protein
MFRWLKVTDNNLRSQAQHFCKYVSIKHRSGYIELEVDGAHLVQPSAAADVFAMHCQYAYNSQCPIYTPPPLLQSSEFLLLTLLPMRMSAKALRN